MNRLLLSMGCILFIALWASAVSAATPFEKPPSDAPRAALVVGEWSPEARSVDEALSSGADDWELLLIRRVPVEAPTRGSTVERWEEIREEGQRRYFFEGEESARQYLAGALAGKFDATRHSMVDAEASTALFEAGLFLVRSYLDMGKLEPARKWMDRLVDALPAHRCDDGIFPPKVVSLWKVSTASRQRSAVRLNLSALKGAQDCRVMINGASPEESTIQVVPNRSYLVSRLCGDKNRQTRWISGVKGADEEAVALHGDLTVREIERHFTRWMSRWDLDIVIYVGPGECGAPNDTPCVAVRRLGGQGVAFQPLDEELIDELSAYAGELSNPNPLAIQMATRAIARKYQVSIYPKWVSAVR